MTTATFGKPDTAAEALALWDSGQSVWTAEMGGIGPGYEQVIHIVAFEVIREVLSRPPIDWADVDRQREADDRNGPWARFTDSVEEAIRPKILGMGCSGAQVGAAQNLAYIVLRKGWAKALDELPSDRLIQVSKDWPRTEAEAK